MEKHAMACYECVHDSNFAFVDSRNPTDDELDHLKSIAKSDCFCGGSGVITLTVLENNMTPEIAEEFLGLGENSS